VADFLGREGLAAYPLQGDDIINAQVVDAERDGNPHIVELQAASPDVN
jgi:hypothetical protein